MYIVYITSPFNVIYEIKGASFVTLFQLNYKHTEKSFRNLIKPKSDYVDHFQIDMNPNRLPFGSKSVVKG